MVAECDIEWAEGVDVEVVLFPWEKANDLEDSWEDEDDYQRGEEDDTDTKEFNDEVDEGVEDDIE